jgi:hypothetical protein
MFSAEFLLGVLALIASTGIFIIYWIIRKIFNSVIARKTAVSLSFTAILLLISAYSYYYIHTHHSAEITIGDKYQIELYAVEQESFLDWPIDFKITIIDLRSDLARTFEFHTSEGPGFQILLSDDSRYIILKGTLYNSFSKWIDLKENTISDFNFASDKDFINYKPVAELNGKFEFVIK